MATGGGGGGGEQRVCAVAAAVAAAAATVGCVAVAVCFFDPAETSFELVAS